MSLRFGERRLARKFIRAGIELWRPDLVIAWRNEGTSRLRDRFQQAFDEGDLASPV